jgi:chromosome segregation ATPase
MVRRFPEWAANRIQDGERSDDRIAELEEQLYEMTPERDSESRWAKEYHDRVKELEAQLAEMKAAQKLAVDNWTLEAQNLKVAENKLTSMVLWLERYQPDVFQRGLWDALNA